MSTRLAVVALAVAVLTSGCALGMSHRPPDNPNLHHVKRVFVALHVSVDAATLAQYEPAVRQRFERISGEAKRRADFLSAALVKRGFVIVGMESDSDATVTAQALQMVVVDDPGPLPRQFGFEAVVRSPALGVNWRTTIHSVNDERHPDAVRRNMETIAERLFKAWKESAVRAGDLTPAQAKTLKRIG